MFRSATLVDTGVLLGFRWHVLARVWRTPRLGELFMRTTTRSGMAMVLRRGQTRPLARERVDAMYAASKDPGTQRAVLSLYRSTPADALASLRDPLRALDRPCLVVWGVDDPYIDVKHAERQKETFPRARIVRFDGCGHWPMFDDPERLAGVVTPFLAEQLSPVGAARSGG